MNKYLLHGKLTAKPGKGQALADILLRASERVARLNGSIIYLVGMDANDPDAVYVTEVWDSKMDHDRSLSDKDVLALITEAMPLLNNQPEKGQELGILGGHGIPQ